MMYVFFFIYDCLYTRTLYNNKFRIDVYMREMKNRCTRVTANS